VSPINRKRTALLGCVAYAGAVNRAVATLVLAIGAVLLAGCSPALSPPGLGVWQLTNVDSVEPSTESLDIEVSRLECSGGVTGEVLEPVVTFEPGRILIRSDVAPLPDGAYDCRGNDWVAVAVELGESVGDREIVDAACLDERAASTVFCEDGGVRWSPSSR
jgi:hypothetical protein